MEKISIIVPVYNVEKYLNKCINSIVRQTYENLEIILVNDGSTDNSASICEEWKKKDGRIVVVHKKNGGLSSARNAGLRVVTGAYVAFVDSDDWIETNMYAKLYKMLQDHPSCQIAKCEEQQVSEVKEQKLSRIKKPKIEEWDKTQMLSFFFRINGEASNTGVWKYLIRKEILKGFTFINTLNEDVEASYEFCKRASRMVVTNERLYAYVQKDDSITHSCFKIKDLDYKHAWESVLQKTKCDFPDYVEYAIFGLKRTSFTLLVKYYIYGWEKDDDEYRKVRNELRQSVKKDFWFLFKRLPISRKMLLLVVLGMPSIIPMIYRMFKNI